MGNSEPLPAEVPTPCSGVEKIAGGGAPSAAANLLGQVSLSSDSRRWKSGESMRETAGCISPLASLRKETMPVPRLGARSLKPQYGIWQDGKFMGQSYEWG